MIVNCNRREFDCKVGDYILDNGNCYQIITKKYRDGYSKLSPKISKGKFNKLLKEGYIRLSKKKYRSQFMPNTLYDLYEFTEKADADNSGENKTET